MELAEAIDNSDLEAFGFTDDFIFEIWGAITGKVIDQSTTWSMIQQDRCF